MKLATSDSEDTYEPTQSDDDFMKLVYESEVGFAFIYEPNYKLYNETILNEVKKGLKIESAFNNLESTSAWEKQLVNVLQFNSAKGSALTKTMVGLMFDEDGNKIPYKQFREVALPHIRNFNKTWLRTEHDTALRSVVMANKWDEMYKTKDLFPYWKYVTRKDNRVRPEHAELDGLIFRFDDLYAQMIYPVNSFNCFEKTTPILTDKGWIEIQKLQIGDNVMGGSGNYRTIDFIHINDFDGNLLRIITKRDSISCTDNHRILTVKGWRESGTLNKGDVIINNTEFTDFNSIIRYVNNSYVFACYVIMSLIIKWHSITKTFKSNIQFRNKYINKIRGYIKIMFNIITFINQIINKHLFYISWSSIKKNVPFRIKSICASNFNRESLSNFFIKKNTFNLHSFAKLHKPFCVIFGFTKIMMRYFFNITTKIFASIITPFICIYPLAFYGITTISNRYIKMIKKSSYSSIITNSPTFLKFSKRIKLNSIKFKKNFGSGAPLDDFNSFNVFLYHILKYKKLNIIVDVNIQKYNDKIYNLSVNIDESYTTKNSIVHNCRCHGKKQIDEVLSISGISKLFSKSKLREGKEVKKLLDKYVDKSFQYNASINGIMPNSDTSYFKVLKSANQTSGQMYVSDKNDLKGVKLNTTLYKENAVIQTFNEWKAETLATKPNDDVIFRNHKWMLNVRMTQDTLKKISKKSVGVQNIKTTIEKPDEIFGKWTDEEKQQIVKMTYVKYGDKGNAYFVETINGNVVNAYYRVHFDSKELRRIGVKLI